MRLPQLGDLPEVLLELLDAAEVFPSREIDADVVTLNSKVVIRDEGNGVSRTVTLCYPGDSAPTEGFISVLSPLGLALLGRRLGRTVHWVPPSGRPSALLIEKILFQPEAMGDFTA